MAIAAESSRRDKLAYLTNPFEWALMLCLVNLAVDFILWRTHATITEIAIAATGSIVLVTMCLAWGLVRIHHAAASH